MHEKKNVLGNGFQVKDFLKHYWLCLKTKSPKQIHTFFTRKWVPREFKVGKFNFHTKHRKTVSQSISKQCRIIRKWKLNPVKPHVYLSAGWRACREATRSSFNTFQFMASELAFRSCSKFPSKSGKQSLAEISMIWLCKAIQSEYSAFQR